MAKLPTSREVSITTPDLDQYIQKMDDHIERFYNLKDRRERFLLMYRTFKNELRKNIQRGRFMDSDWTEAICCRMAEMYFEAYEQYESDPNSTPDSWKICFDTSIRKENNLLQDALLGMNAHINYDLPICTYDIMLRFNDLSPGKIPVPLDRGLNEILQKRYFDFLMINQIAWESIELIQDVLSERFSKMIGALNRMTFRVSKRIVEQIIVEYRDKAWGNSLLLLSTKNEAELNKIKEFIDKLAVKNIMLVKNKLNFNPVVLVNNWRGSGFFSYKIEQNEFGPEVIELLIERLKNPNTSEFTFRAVCEYGSEIVPHIRKYIDSEDPFLRTKIIEILHQIKSEEAVEIIAGRLQKEEDETIRLRLTKFLSSDLVKSRIPAEKIISTETLKAELRKYYEYIYLYETLKNVEPEVLIHESIRRIITYQSKLVMFMLSVRLNDKRLTEYFESGNLEQLSSNGDLINKFEDEEVISLLTPFLDENSRSTTEKAQNLFHCNQFERWEWVKGIFRSKKNYFYNSLLICIAAAFKTGESLNFLLETGEDDDLREELIWCLKGLENDDEIPEKYRSELKNIINQKGNEMLSAIEKVLYFKNVELFREVPAEFLINLAKSSSEKSYSKGEFLIEEGSTNNDLILIISGKVAVQDKNGNKLSTISENAVAGEMSLLTDSKASAHCVAETEVKTLNIPHKTFKDYLISHTEISFGLLKVLAQKLERTNRIVAENSMKIENQKP